MNQTIQKIFNVGAIPVIGSENFNNAADIASALSEGGFNVVEVACTCDEAIPAIRAISSALPQMLVGAGSLTSRDLADMAVGAGAAFLTAFGSNPRLIEYCVEMGHLILPGCSSPSEIEAAFELGLETVNIFPADLIGGPRFVVRMAEKYPEMDFIVSGGITGENINEYLALPGVVACHIDSIPAADGDLAALSAFANSLMLSILGFSLAHVGINCADYDGASSSAQTLSGLFGFPFLPGPISVFSGTFAEFMIPPCRGDNGHIGFFTNSVPRAMAWLSARGVEFIEESIRYNEAKLPRFAYLKDPLCGFALHLTQK